MAAARPPQRQGSFSASRELPAMGLRSAFSPRSGEVPAGSQRRWTTSVRGWLTFVRYISAERPAFMAGSYLVPASVRRLVKAEAPSLAAHVHGCLPSCFLSYSVTFAASCRPTPRFRDGARNGSDRCRKRGTTVQDGAAGTHHAGEEVCACGSTMSLALLSALV